MEPRIFLLLLAGLIGATTAQTVNATESQADVTITAPQATQATTSENATSQQMSKTSPLVDVTSPSTLSPVIQTSAPSNATSPLTLPSTIRTTVTTATPTTTTTTTTTPAPPEPKIKLEFKVIETFTEDLRDKASQKFKELEKTVTTALDAVYFVQFGDRFNRSVINGFSQGSIVVDSELIFNNVTALPNTSDVSEALKNATSNSAFNFTVDTSSIVVAVVTPPTEPPTTTTAPTAGTTSVNSTSVTGNGTSTQTGLVTTTVLRTTMNSTVSPGSPATNMTSPPNTITSITVNITSPAASPATIVTSPTPHNVTSPAGNGTSTQTITPTTATTTTTPAVPADSKLNLQFWLNQDFNNDLDNSASQGFKNLAETLTRQLDDIYRRRFAAFLRVLIKAFRRGSVIVDSELQFANESSVPDTKNVADILLEAHNTSNFNFSLDITSVVVTRLANTTNSTTVNPTVSPASLATNVTSSTPHNVTSAPVSPISPATNMTSPPNKTTSITINTTSPAGNGTSTQTITPTTATTTTTPAVPADSKLNLQFRLNQDFTNDLATPTSPAFQILAQSLTRQLDVIYRRRFAAFLRVLIKAFRRGSVIVDSELQFANVSSVPDTKNVADTLLETHNTSNFNFSLDITSVVVACLANTTNSTIVNTTVSPASPATIVTSPTPHNVTSPAGNGTSTQTITPTTATTTTTPAVPTDSKLNLQFRLNQDFTNDLDNSASQGFKNLAETLTRQLDVIYRRRFAAFLRVLIKAFRRGSVIVDSELQFANESSVPDTKNVADTLLETHNTSNFNFSLDITSVAVTSLANTTNSTTVNPTVSQDSKLNLEFRLNQEFTNNLATSTSPAIRFIKSPPGSLFSTTGTTANTITTTTASTNPPSASEGSLSIKFSLNEPFTSDLANNTSAAFIKLASTVVIEINRICGKLFSRFSRSRVNSFTEGSVVTNMTLVFRDSSSVPTLSAVQSQLANALLTSPFLQYINGTLVVVTSNSAALPTMGGLTVFSLTMVAVAQMLLNS